MDKDKDTDFEDTFGTSSDEFASDSSSRARNRTVMLTPDTIGQVREQLAKDIVPKERSGGARAGQAEGRQEPAGQVGGSRYTPGGQGASSSPPAATPPPQAPTPSPTFSNTDGWGNPVTEYVVWMKESPIVGFLVSYDENPNGSVFELRAGRLIVTSESPGSGNFLVIQSDSVSPMHAIMRIGKDGDLQVLDQLSEFGTRIIRLEGEEDEELSGDKSSLEHGDTIFFGERKFHVCMVTREELEEEGDE